LQRRINFQLPYVCKKMKKLILISALLFSFNGWADEEGLMRCEIKSMGLETIEDGQPKSFTGYEDSEKVGDTLHFTYQISSLTKVLMMKITHPQNEKSLNFTGAYGFINLNQNFSNTFTYEGKYNQGSFGKDFIRINSYGSELRMRRYYKSDWQGIFVRNNFAQEGIYYFTLDCRHSKDLIDEVYETISELHDQKFPKEN